jgi:putative oxidoreductase
MKQLENINNLIARIFLASLFLMAGISKLGAGYAGTQAYMDAMGVSPSLLPLVIILEIGGAIALIVGFKTKLTALLLAGFTLVAAILFHGNFADQMQSILFMKNIAITGGLLVLVTAGAGRLSIDNRLQQA